MTIPLIQWFMIGLFGMVCGMLLGIYVGYRWGALHATRKDWEAVKNWLDGEPLPDDMLAEFVRDTMRESTGGHSIWDELANDSVYQQQLREQARDKHNGA